METKKTPTPTRRRPIIATYLEKSELDQVRKLAAADNRTVSAWIRMAVLAALAKEKK